MVSAGVKHARTSRLIFFTAVLCFLWRAERVIGKPESHAPTPGKCSGCAHAKQNVCRLPYRYAILGSYDR